MNNIINLKEFRENVAEYADRVARGDSFFVMKRSKVLFKVCPVHEEGWETVIDFTALKKGGISAKELLEKMKQIA
jgi:antitoxin (DNA-binding transcriptional repressor) of toxin-antitoxin stability system